MQQVKEPMETIHVYVTREEIVPAPSRLPLVLPLVLSALALSAILAVGILSPYQPPEVRETLRVPAILLPLRTFTASIKVAATGIKTYPATAAHGLLTITNGSIITETLPMGMLVSTNGGEMVFIDTRVVVPPASATTFGYAIVSAHAVVSGAQGNIPALAINQVMGTSLFVRNLNAFAGGRDAYTTHFITAQDRKHALQAARGQLTTQTSLGILAYPCREAISGNYTMRLTWVCQYAVYHVPASMRVVNVVLKGKYFLIDVTFVVHPRPFLGK